MRRSLTIQLAILIAVAIQFTPQSVRIAEGQEVAASSEVAYLIETAGLADTLSDPKTRVAAQWRLVRAAHEQRQTQSCL